MATSSIYHNFVIDDASAIEKLADALSRPKDNKVSSINVNTISGKKSLNILVEKWKDGQRIYSR